MDLRIAWGQIALIILLLVYTGISKRSKFFPNIPLALVLIYLVLQLVAGLAEGQTWATSWLNYLNLAATIALAWAVARLIFWLLVEVPIQVRKAQPLPKITRDFFLFISFSILFFFVLRMRSNIDLASLLTTSAVLTAVIGLAAQATLSNFFSGLMLQADKPLALGDWVRLGEHEGRVTSITWKSTQLLTRDHYLVYVPNSQMAASTFINYSRPTRQLIARLNIGLEYDAPPNKVRAAIKSVFDNNPKVMKTPPYRIRLTNFGDFAITYQVVFWHKNYTQQPQLLADLNNDLWYALRRYNITIPFPIRDLRHAHEERHLTKEEKKAAQGKLIDLINQVPILETLSETDRSKLADQVSLNLYGTGEDIVVKDAPGDSMYIIYSGSCDVLNGAGKKVAEPLTVGSFFGEMSLLTGEPRTATIKAIEDTQVVRIDKTAFADILSNNSHIVEALGKVLSQRQKELDAESNQVVNDTLQTRRFMTQIRRFLGLPQI